VLQEVVRECALADSGFIGVAATRVDVPGVVVDFAEFGYFLH